MSPPIHEWRKMKFGMFIHWGIYAIPAGIWKDRQIPRLGEQIQRHAAIPQDEYAALAPQFNPVKFDPDEYVRLAKKAGMNYIVMTSKHHDGFNMFHTNLSDYNIVDATPFKKDVIKQLADACARGGIRFGVYYSNPDWHFPDAYERESETGYSVFEEIPSEQEEYMVGQLEELLTDYGPLCEIFFDMGRPTLKQSTRFAATVHRLQPQCLVSGRVNNNQGDFLTMPDNKLPQEVIKQPWETPGTLYTKENNTWGYKSWVKRPPPEEQVRTQIRRLSDVVGRGGNFLLNIGPLADGAILEYEQKVLEEIGTWMDVHGEAIYDSGANPFKKLPWGQCSVKPGILYLHIHDWPENGELVVPGLKSKIEKIEILSGKEVLSYYQRGNDIAIQVSSQPPDPYVPILKVSLGSDLHITDPLALPNEERTIYLTSEVEFSHGHYDGVTYRSLYPDVWRSWDFSLESSGVYEIAVTYRMDTPQREYIFSVGDESISVELAGDGGDGTWLTRSIGVMKIEKSARHTLLLRSGRLPEDEKNPEHPSLHIEIEHISLIRK